MLLDYKKHYEYSFTSLKGRGGALAKKRKNAVASPGRSGRALEGMSGAGALCAYTYQKKTGRTIIVAPQQRIFFSILKSVA